MPLLELKENLVLKWTITKVSDIENFQKLTKFILESKQAEGFQVQNQQNSQNGKGKKIRRKLKGNTEEGTAEL